jgi:hypothetical protein
MRERKRDTPTSESPRGENKVSSSGGTWIRGGLELFFFCLFPLKDKVRVEKRGWLKLP